MIKQYQVVASAHWANLAQQVNLAIEDGWQPYGNLMINLAGVYIQPVVKYEKLTSEA